MQKTMFCFFNGAQMTPSASRVIIALINNMDSQKDMIPAFEKKKCIKHGCASFRTNLQMSFDSIDFLNLN